MRQEMIERLSSGSGIVVLVLLATVVIVAAQTATGPVEVNPGPVEVKIDSVLAADTNQGCDKQLSTLRDRLRRLFHFTTYRLMSHDEGSRRLRQDCSPSPCRAGASCISSRRAWTAT